MLEVQKYLQTHTLEDLKEQFDISLRYDDAKELVLLKYSQINSPKSHPIVRECRGLILEVGTWKLISMAFYRFFNYGENQSFDSNDKKIEPNFDFSKAKIMEKMDGSLISIFTYKNQWRIATSGSIDNNTYPTNSDKTFSELVLDALPIIHSEITIMNTPIELYDNILQQKCQNFNKDYIYVFELTSPKNTIVTPYSETKLTLLTARNKNNNFNEVSLNELRHLENEIKIYEPELYNAEDITELYKMHDNMKSTDEGFVAVIYEKGKQSYTRVKVKNPRYVELHHLLNNVNSEASILSLIIQNETEEVLSYFPHYRNQFEELTKKYENYKQIVLHLRLKYSVDLVTIDKDKIRKDFAMKVNTEPNFIRNYLFQIFNGAINTYEEYEANQIERSGLKNYSKKLLENFEAIYEK